MRKIYQKRAKRESIYTTDVELCSRVNARTVEGNHFVAKEILASRNA